MRTLLGGLVMSLVTTDGMAAETLWLPDGAAFPFWEDQTPYRVVYSKLTSRRIFYPRPIR